MNNDIWSPRKEPLVAGTFIWLKTHAGFEVPEAGEKMFFINSRLRQAHIIEVGHTYQAAQEFEAFVVKETEYEDVLQNH